MQLAGGARTLSQPTRPSRVSFTVVEVGGTTQVRFEFVPLGSGLLLCSSLAHLAEQGLAAGKERDGKRTDRMDDGEHRAKHHCAAGHLSLFLSFAETLTRQLLI